MCLRIRVPVDRDDTEVTVTLTDAELLAAIEGRDSHARVVIDRDGMAPATGIVKLERVAA
jgi:hypothetical protein